MNIIGQIVVFTTSLLVSYSHAAQVNEVSYYVHDFERRYHINTSAIDIEFVGDFPGFPSRVGLCMVRPDDTKVIEVKHKFWDLTTESQRTLLIYHELGHCVLDILRHREEIFPDKCPQSLMSSTLPKDKCFKKYKKHYYQELIKY